MYTKKIEAVTNGLMAFLGLAFLGDILDVWHFQPFDGWWLLFLYIPAVGDLLTKGLTAGTVMLACTAVVLTIGRFVDTDGRLWSVALLIYLSYVSLRAITLHPPLSAHLPSLGLC